MFSRCPHCDKQRKVSIKQLRDGRGLLKCKRCGQTFEALASLSERQDEKIKPRAGFELALRQEDQRPVRHWAWSLGSALMVLMLAAQIGYFETSRPAVQSVLALACLALNCDLPPVSNPQEWAISHSDLQPQLDNRYWLTAALTNQAGIKQVFPKLKLTLMDFNGGILAERVLAPRQYVRASELAADETVEIRLPLTIPAADIGGFTLTTL